ncbi:PspC domain-containing protein [Sinanaerobacter sp. ZZT-01]|uniref:PspC domain-containing protein n=1 Tax=Sinanaerobacter sp. ZZT-01 TaxID=3111540 RepID=UPI002D770D66|nr:PspC domain-containing protein [Sinanaerobacter sp. ZZT-01]WRR94322.1 PspC domain-containing protein [Sinanaerobacter sp. ZZT-01]
MEKRLYKSRDDRAIMGVCGGIAEYFEIDSVIVRLLAVVFIFMAGASIWAYIIAAIVIPERPIKMMNEEYGSTYENGEYNAAEEKSSTTEKGRHSSKLAIGAVFLFLGLYLLLKIFVPYFDGRIIMAIAFILIGIGVIATK